MYEFVIIVVAVIILVFWFKKSEKKGNSSKQSNSESFTIRMGKVVKTDQAFDAWTSGDFSKMMQALDVKTNLIDRHYLLLGIVEETYRKRKEAKMRKICQEIAEQHLSEFSKIAPALKKEMGGELPRVPTFQHYATILTEDGNYEGAIAVCELALKFGLHDNTQSGFEGRIQRIEKRQNNENKKKNL